MTTEARGARRRRDCPHGRPAADERAVKEERADAQARIREATVTGGGAWKTWSQAMRPSSTPHAIYAAAVDSGRMIAGVWGGLVFFFYCVPLAVLDPNSIEHSHSLGATMIGLSFLLIAVGWSRPRSACFLGVAGNEVRLRCQQLDL